MRDRLVILIAKEFIIWLIHYKTRTRMLKRAEERLEEVGGLSDLWNSPFSHAWVYQIKIAH